MPENRTTSRRFQWQPLRSASRPLGVGKPLCGLALVLVRRALRHLPEVQTMNNQITIVGHVGQNPHSVSFGDTGNKVVKFSVAVREYSSKSDEKKTLWLDVDAWNGLGDRVLQTVTKGRELVVVGRLGISSYQKEINGEKVQMSKPVIKLSSFPSVARSRHLKMRISLLKMSLRELRERPSLLWLRARSFRGRDYSLRSSS